MKRVRLPPSSRHRFRWVESFAWGKMGLKYKAPTGKSKAAYQIDCPRTGRREMLSMPVEVSLTG
eukprot:12748328-Alexandrium_andersonii.AAC.1